MFIAALPVFSSYIWKTHCWVLPICNVPPGLIHYSKDFRCYSPAVKVKKCQKKCTLNIKVPWSFRNFYELQYQLERQAVNQNVDSNELWNKAAHTFMAKRHKLSFNIMMTKHPHACSPQNPQKGLIHLWLSSVASGRTPFGPLYAHRSNSDLIRYSHLKYHWALEQAGTSLSGKRRFIASARKYVEH